MYDLPYHKAQDEKDVEEFISKHPFAFLTGCNADNQTVATQVPMFFEEKDGRRILSGHFMKNTDHHKAFLQNNKALAVFTSPHSYVSATWYSNPSQGSTWNYMSVQVQGTISFQEGEALDNILRKTTLHFENNDASSATVFDNLPAEYKQRVMKAIVAFEIEITDIKNVFKLSQDKDEESYQNIIAKLREQDDSGRFIAGEMEKRAENLFSK